MLHLLPFLGLLTLTANVAAIATVKAFNWNCNPTPDTCNNACYLLYAYGEDIGTLSFDPNVSRRRKRRTASGCSRNPCNNKKLPYGKSGSSCDEYPFASTYQGGQGASLRCVSPTENSREGNQLKNFYASFGRTDGQSFNVFFKNYKSAPYCTRATKKNDGFEFRLQNGKFTTYRRDVDEYNDEAIKDVPDGEALADFPDDDAFEDSPDDQALEDSPDEDPLFEDIPPRNVTIPEPRLFEVDDGTIVMLLGRNEGRRYEGVQLWDDGKYNMIVRELDEGAWTYNGTG